MKILALFLLVVVVTATADRHAPHRPPSFPLKASRFSRSLFPDCPDCEVWQQCGYDCIPTGMGDTTCFTFCE